MTIYQQELLRKLSKYGCTGQYNETGERLEVSYDGIPLCSQDEDGFLQYHEDKAVTNDWKIALENMKELAAKIREYVRMYETAPQWKFPMFPNTAEWQNTAIPSSPVCTANSTASCLPHGRQSADKSSVAHGDYTPNFDYVKESFIIRSGLLDRNRLLTEDEAANLCRCIGIYAEQLRKPDLRAGTGAEIP